MPNLLKLAQGPSSENCVTHSHDGNAVIIIKANMTGTNKNNILTL